jgi:hypothetical protein
MKILFLLSVLFTATVCNSQTGKKDASVVFMSGTNMFFKNSSLNPGIEFVFSTTVVEHLFMGAQIGVTHLRTMQGAYFPVAANFKVSPTDASDRIRPYIDVSAGYGIRNKQVAASQYSKGGFLAEGGLGLMDKKSHMNLSIKYINATFKTTVAGNEFLKDRLEGVVLNLGVFF